MLLIYTYFLVPVRALSKMLLFVIVLCLLQTQDKERCGSSRWLSNLHLCYMTTVQLMCPNDHVVTVVESTVSSHWYCNWWYASALHFYTAHCSYSRYFCCHVVVGRVVKQSSKIRSLIYKFEFKFSFLAFAIRSVIVPQGHAFNKLHKCIIRISNAWLRGARPPQAAGEVKYGAQFLSSLDSNRLQERVQSACALKRGGRSVMLMPAAVYSPDVCFPESCHTEPCVYDGSRVLNQRTCVAVTALMVFTHVYSVYTLSNTCRPTRPLMVKVRRWPSRLAHIINVWHREWSCVYYIGLPTRQTPVTAVNTRWQQAAYARSCCINRWL